MVYEYNSQVAEVTLNVKDLKGRQHILVFLAGDFESMGKRSSWFSIKSLVRLIKTDDISNPKPRLWSLSYGTSFAIS